MKAESSGEFVPRVRIRKKNTMVKRKKEPAAPIVSDEAAAMLNTWKAAMAQMKGSMDRQTFSTLLGHAELLAQAENIFTVGVENGFTRNWAEQRLSATLEQILSTLCGRPQKVVFVVRDQYKAESKKAEPSESAEEERSPDLFSIPQTRSEDVPQRPRIPVLDRFTFENFIVSDNNNFAHAAARIVAETPGAAYNPLFIYGGVGMGKTHLLHAIGNRLKETNLNVVYVSSEEFTNDFIHSIQNRESASFRTKYRSADVLLIDDIQFIIGKDSTQEAFFHTFNKLYEMDKQIVITSDRPPKDMSALDDRMRSRFEWGLTVDIQPADLDARIAILSAKIDKLGKKVPADVIELIARQVTSNVRELEGALNRVLAVSDLCGQPLTRDLVRTTLSNMAPRKTNSGAEDVIAAAAEVFAVTAEAIKGRDRSKNVALARQVVMYVLREELSLSLPQIGQALGGRDHTTVLHGCEKVASLLETNSSFGEQVTRIREKIKHG